MINATSTFRLCLAALWWNGISFHQVHSFSSVTANINFFPSPIDRQCESVVVGNDIAFRIRSTRESDIQGGISDMWATVIVGAGAPTHKESGISHSAFNFRQKVYLLKTKECVEQLLRARLRAIRVGEKTMEECSICFGASDEQLSEAQKLRYLWSSERFRDCMEIAAKLSEEPHKWKSHNFSCAPKNTECLQHKMLTAEDRNSGAILGFCEIAMLVDPSVEEQEHLEAQVHPTIVNLVVSPKHRRCGVASRIIRSAENYVYREWGAGNLNLFVDEDNEAAISLYRRLGFKRMAIIPGTEQKVSQWYMTMSVQEKSRQRQQRPARRLALKY